MFSFFLKSAYQLILVSLKVTNGNNYRDGGMKLIIT